METLLNVFFEASAWIISAVVLCFLLAVARIGRANRFFLPRAGWKIALDATLFALLALLLVAAYFAGRIQHALEARVAGLELRLVRDGTERRIADYRGKLVVLNLWATWCESCREEMSELSRLAQAHRNGELVILAATDETVDEIRRYEQDTAPILVEAVTFRDVRPPTGGFDAFIYKGRPITFIVGRDGSIRRLLVGAQQYDALDRAVRTSL